MDDTVDELRWWMDMLAEADRLHRQLPAAMIREIEASAGAHEIMRLAVMWSSVSCETRQRVQATLEHAMCALRVVGEELNPPAARLRVVESAN